jgi:hypothetical protein
MATLDQFLRTGDLDPIHVGMNRDEVLGILGLPGDESVSRHPQILKYGGLQVTLFKPAGSPDYQLSQIGLYYSPAWEAIPEIVRPVDFTATPATTPALMREFLDSTGLQVHSTVKSDCVEHFILPGGSRITFDDGQLQSIAFARKANVPRKQISVPIPLDTWEKVQELARESNRSIPDLCAEWISRSVAEFQHGDA